MPLRAIRQIHLPELATCSFASTLQLAAGRAWSQRVAARLPPSGPGEARHMHATSPCRLAAKRAAREAERDKPARAGPSTVPIHEPSKTKKTRKAAVQVEVSEARPTPVARPKPLLTPFANNAMPTESLPPEKLPTALQPKTLTQPRDLPPPTSKAELNDNIIKLISEVQPPPRLPVILDYHDEYPQWKSTASYNSVMYLAIRHQSYEIVKRLIRKLIAEGHPRDFESYQLEVRTLVQEGKWDEAWKYVRMLLDEGLLPGYKNDAIPLPLWLEFCRPSRRPKIKARLIHDETGRIIQKYLEKVQPPLDESRAQHALLNQNPPQDIPVLAKTPPYVIYCIVHLLFRSGEPERASELTRAFFRVMPRELTPSEAHRCLEIIHINMVYCQEKDGLQRFYEARRTMYALIRMHPMVRPTARTMYLLLAPLKRAKKCGTISLGIIEAAKRKWGDEMEDRRVLRRILHFALKEGRKDIVKKAVEAERRLRKILLEKILRMNVAFVMQRRRGAPLSQANLPIRIIYPRLGRESRLWYRTRTKVFQKSHPPGMAPPPRRLRTPRSIRCPSTNH